MLTLPNNITGLLPRPLTAECFRAFGMCKTQRAFWGQTKDESGKRVKSQREQSEKSCVYLCSQSAQAILFGVGKVQKCLPSWNPSLLPLCSLLSEDLPIFRLKGSWSRLWSHHYTSELQRTAISTMSRGLRLKLFMKVTPSEPFKEAELQRLSIWISVAPSQTRSRLELFFQPLKILAF